jgi:hypothetical protein
VANQYNANPFYIDTDTTFAGNTNWKGTSGGSKFTGGIGIRPQKIVVVPLGATTAGLITVNMINSTGGGTGPVLFEAEVPTATAIAATSAVYDIVGGTWKDFIVTGCTAANAAILVYYRV